MAAEEMTRTVSKVVMDIATIGRKQYISLDDLLLALIENQEGLDVGAFIRELKRLKEHA